MNNSVINCPIHGLPEDQIAAAAYAIWEREGRPEGRDKQHWSLAIEQILSSEVTTLRQHIAQFPPPTMTDLWRQLELARHAIQVATEDATVNALWDRSLDSRDQATDNRLLRPLSDAINRAIQQGDFRLAATVFRQGYGAVLEYEKRNGCEVHKGALAFDVARSYLQSWDFYAAMHYFELAQHETRLTTGDMTFNIYKFDLFGSNFWDAVDADAKEYPIEIYQQFWGKSYGKACALDDYGNLSDESKLAYVIVSAERIRLRRIAEHSEWDGSNSLRLGYWTLAADLARLIEVEAKKLSSAKQDTLLACLLQGFNNTAYGKLTSEINSLHGRYDISQERAIANYEKHFDSILQEVRDDTKTIISRLSHALYLLGVTRNQVAHRLGQGTKLFKQLEDARFLVDLFLTLCRTSEWKQI